MNLHRALEMVAELSTALIRAKEAEESHLADRNYYKAEWQRLQTSQANSPNKVQMIKNLRTAFGLGLKEAKEVIDIACGSELYARSTPTSVGQTLGELLKSKLDSLPGDH